MTTNSSPPRRARKSPRRAASDMRRAISLRIASPTAWPWVSLARLKSSRSTNSTATASLLRLARASAWSRNSIAAARLCRPVSASWVAWCTRRCCRLSRSTIDPDSTTTDSCSAWPRRPGSGSARTGSSKEHSASARVLASSRRRLETRSLNVSETTTVSLGPRPGSGGSSRSPLETARAWLSRRRSGWEIDLASSSATAIVRPTAMIVSISSVRKSAALVVRSVAAPCGRRCSASATSR